MKELVKRVREEKDGFTIAELLIVVAIVAVLVAIAIPVFTSSLNGAIAGTDQANARSLYGDMQANWLSDKANFDLTDYGVTAGTATSEFNFSDGQEIKLNDANSVKVTVGADGVYVEFTDGLTNEKNGKWGKQSS